MFVSMNIVVILVIIAVVALMLGPIMLMQPSPQQRKTAALRQYALQRGVRVSMQASPMVKDTENKSEMMPAYSFPWTENGYAKHQWLMLRTQYDHELHAYGVWDWRTRPNLGFEDELVDLLKRSLDLLPESVVGLGAGPQGISVFWDESGGQAVFDEILTSSSHIRSALVECYDRHSPL